MDWGLVKRLRRVLEELGAQAVVEGYVDGELRERGGSVLFTTERVSDRDRRAILVVFRGGE